MFGYTRKVSVNTDHASVSASNSFFLSLFPPSPASSGPIVIHQAVASRGNVQWVSEDKSLIHQTSSTPTPQLTQQLLHGITNSLGGRGAVYTSIQHTHRLLLEGRSDPQNMSSVSHILLRGRTGRMLSGLRRCESE